MTTGAHDSPGLEPPEWFKDRRSPAANALFDASMVVYPVVLTLVLTPVILHFIGVEDYGLFALAMVLVSFLGLLDLGMSPAVTRFLAAGLARSDFEEARSVVGVGVLFFLVVGAVGASVVLLVGQWLPAVLSLSETAEPNARFVFSIAGVGFFFSALLYPACGIPSALQRNDVLAKARFLSTTAGAVATVTILWLGAGVRGLIVVAALQPCLYLALVTRINRRLLPEVKLWPRFDPVTLRKMITFSGYSFVSNLAGTLLLQLDKVVLGAYSGASAVAYYVVPANLAQRLHTSVASLTTISLAVSTDLHARGASEELRRFYVRATRAVSLIIVAFGLPVFVFAHEILLQWVGSTFAQTSTDTLRVLILTYGVLAFSVLPYYMTLAFGRPQISALFNVVAAAINIVLVFILIPEYGLIGAAIAYLVATAVLPGMTLYVERRLLQLEASLWPALLARLSLVAVGQTLVCLLLQPLTTGLAPLLGVLLLAVATAPLLALVTGYLTAQDRMTIKRFVPMLRVRNETR